MKRLYQQTFDRIHMPDERVRALRDDLTSRCSKTETEVTTMKKLHPRPVSITAAIVMICVLTITAFAYGEEITAKIYQFMTGGTVTETENGDAYSGGEVSETTAPVEVREDGRLYLVINGENLDITDECSYTDPYIYECIGKDGLRHAFVIGGNLDAIGWSEFIWDENGMPAGGSAEFGTNGGSDDAPWLDVGMDELGLPW